MLRFVRSQLRHRRSRTGALGGAILLAAVSFVLLSSAATTSDLRVRGSVNSNFRNAYDILVRPRGSFTQLEQQAGLVRDNYLSGIFGGISIAQYERIKRIPGIDVAAPIANIGYVMPLHFVRLSIGRHLTGDPFQLFRLRLTWVAQRGLSNYPAGDAYVYYTTRDPFVACCPPIQQLPTGERVNICDPFRFDKPFPTGPFAPRRTLACFSALSPGQGFDHPSFGQDRLHDLREGDVIADVYFPMLIAAIDPVEEARLVQLDSAVVRGRYLDEGDRAFIREVAPGVNKRFVPMIASTKAFVDERLRVDVERLHLPLGIDLPRALASRRSYTFVTGLRGTAVGREEIDVQPVYTSLLKQQKNFNSFAYWQPGETNYRVEGENRLEPVPVTNSIGIWRTPYTESGYWPVAPANQDVHFRRLTEFVASNLFGAQGVLRRPDFEIVGRYDPTRLPGFSPLSRVPLETYYPPELKPADEASKRALSGKPLLPTQNLGDYVQQPPLMLTTLEGMKPFLNPAFFEGAGRTGKAPISVIRVRVNGVSGPDTLSQVRIKAVALAIRDATGLDVDITAGSSPRQLRVVLPKGKFGRPALELEEGWVKKGVSVSFLRAVDRKSLALLGLVLVICTFFLGNGAFAAVRARRREIGTLLCLGWPQRAIFAVVLGELALLGLVAGALGAALAAVVVSAFSLEMPLVRSLLVIPVAVALAVVAGLLPARAAARSVPLDAVRPAVAGETARRRVRSLARLALANLRRLPARTLVGAGGLAVGVAALALLLGINRAFKGTLVDTLLGQAILFRIKDVDFLAVAVTIGLAGLSIADVLFLNLRERAAELVTLRTFGWDESHLRRLVALEGLGLGLAGAAAGALLAFALGALVLGVPAGSLALAALLAAGGGLAVALLASLAPLSKIQRLTPPGVLAEE